jgi:hypothetical protein
MVQQRCPEADVRVIPGADDGVLRSEPAFRDHGVHFFDEYVAAITEVPDGSLDIVIVDGICRLDCVRKATSKLRPGGLLVVDDTDRDFIGEGLPYVAELKGWSETREGGFKRRSPGFTETSFFRKPQ